MKLGNPIWDISGELFRAFAELEDELSQLKRCGICYYLNHVARKHCPICAAFSVWDGTRTRYVNCNTGVEMVNWRSVNRQFPTDGPALLRDYISAQPRELSATAEAIKHGQAAASRIRAVYW